MEGIEARPPPHSHNQHTFVARVDNGLDDRFIQHLLHLHLVARVDV